MIYACVCVAVCTLPPARSSPGAGHAELGSPAGREARSAAVHAVNTVSPCHGDAGSGAEPDPPRCHGLIQTWPANSLTST